MKVVTRTKYGSPKVLKIQEVEKQTPKKHEALVEVFATPCEDFYFQAQQISMVCIS